MINSAASTRFHNPETIYSLIETGLVVDFNPKTNLCSVKMDKAGVVHGIPVLNLYGAQHGSDVSTGVNLRGSVVLMVRVYNQLHILATVPTQITTDVNIADKGTVPGYGGDNKYTYGQDTDKDYSAMRPTDYLPGDKVNKVDGGAEHVLMKEGVNCLKASPLAQFVLCKIKDLGRMITRVFQHYTDFGEVEFTHNSSGRVGLVIRGGADFQNETHPSKAKFTVIAHLGDNPDNPEDRLHIKVCNPDGSNYVTTAYTLNGDATFKTSNDYKEEIGNDHKVTVVGNENVSVVGDKTDYVTGNYTITASSFNIVSK